MAKTCKFYKYQKYASYDGGSTWQPLDEYQRGELYEQNSPDCGGGVTYYRWQNLDPEEDYYCEGTTKLYKQQKQVSTDNVNWTNVVPAEYQQGMPYEYNSEDCGYVPPTGYSTQYLTFVAEEDCQFSFYVPESTSPTGQTLYYSIDDGETWHLLKYLKHTLTIHNGQRIIWKQNYDTHSIEVCFSSEGKKFHVEGNVMSLMYGDDFVQWMQYVDNPLFPVGSSMLTKLFCNCTGLTNAENLILPFVNLGSHCYEHMFDGCINLTKAPVLPATTLAEWCYFCMFRNCSSLNAITCLATNKSASYCTTSWVDGVAANGTFTKNASMSSWSTGSNGIPSNWTVQDAS